MTDGLFYRRTELARLLECDPRTVDRGIEAGTIPAVRIGKVVRIPIAAAHRALGLDISVEATEADGPVIQHLHAVGRGRGTAA